MQPRPIEVDTAFRELIEDPTFPCLGAKSVVRLDGYTLEVYGVLADESEAHRIVGDLAKFGAEVAGDDRGFKAFVAVFPESAPTDEIAFEHELWRQLQLLHDADPARESWAPETSSDPEDPHFSFSIGGQAFSSWACTR